MSQQFNLNDSQRTVQDLGAVDETVKAAVDLGNLAPSQETVEICNEYDQAKRCKLKETPTCTPTKFRSMDLSSKITVRRLSVFENGKSRVLLPVLSQRTPSKTNWHNSSVEKGASKITSSPSNINGCDCAPIVKRIEERLPEALLSKREQEKRKFNYSYRKLSNIIMSTAFDAFGNWRVHRKCLSEVIPVSMGWLSNRHSEAVERAGEPTMSMTKQEISSCPRIRINELVENIILPSECTLTSRAFFRSQHENFKFKLSKPLSKHALEDHKSNRSKLSERLQFSKFVKFNRQPTGRTVSQSKRSHGLVYYLDTLYTCVRAKSDDPDQQACSLALTFNDALRKNWELSPNGSEPSPTFNGVAGSTVQTWWKEDFGSRIMISGILIPSSEYTTLYPHKTDACATCEVLNKEMRTLVQRKKRHESQADRGTLSRIDSIKEVTKEIDEVQWAIRPHRKEASAAISFHKDCLEQSYEQFKGFKRKYEDLMEYLETDSVSSDKENAIEKLSSSVSKGWFEISSDYQQDKSIPCWNRSPQPGPTSYMSGLTHYVHILCLESCGLTTGSTKFSRNIVFTRSEHVVGAKVADDTLSTLTYSLLGYRTPSFSQPKIFRTGFDANGSLADNDAPMESQNDIQLNSGEDSGAHGESEDGSYTMSGDSGNGKEKTEAQRGMQEIQRSLHDASSAQVAVRVDYKQTIATVAAKNRRPTSLSRVQLRNTSMATRRSSLVKRTKKM